MVAVADRIVALFAERRPPLCIPMGSDAMLRLLLLRVAPFRLAELIFQTLLSRARRSGG